MKKRFILISLVERNEYIVNLEIYLFSSSSEAKLLQKFEIMRDNITDSLNALFKLVVGYKVKILMSPYNEEYKKISFSDIGSINVSKNLKKMIRDLSVNNQVVHSLLVNKPNHLTKSWNFILIVVPFHKITDQILKFLVEQGMRVKKVFLNSLVNLDIVNRVLNLAPVKQEFGKTYLNITVSQIGKYLHVIVFVNNCIYEICRYTLSNIKNNTEEIVFRIQNIKNTILSSSLMRKKDSEVQYVLLNDTEHLEKVLFASSNNFSIFFYKKLLLSKAIQDIKPVVNMAPFRSKVIATKLLHFSKLKSLARLRVLFNRSLLCLAVIFLVLSVFSLYMISRSNNILISLEQKYNIHKQKLLQEDKDQKDRISGLSSGAKKIFYNLKNNKYPLELFNIIKKVKEYHLIITNVEYVEEKDEKKIVLDMHIPRDVSSRNKALDKITNFFQYLKLNLPSHNEIRFYRDTNIQSDQKGIPVQIVIIDSKV